MSSHCALECRHSLVAVVGGEGREEVVCRDVPDRSPWVPMQSDSCLNPSKQVKSAKDRRQRDMVRRPKDTWTRQRNDKWIKTDT